jgi:hypothetical protein
MRILTGNGAAAAGDVVARRLVVKRPKKITFAEMRLAGVRGLLVCCADYRCSHHTTISSDRWADIVEILSRDSPAPPAAGAAPMYDLTSIGTSRMRSPGDIDVIG